MQLDSGMGKPERPFPTESPLVFQIDAEPAPESLTALGDMSLVEQAFRSLGLPAGVNHNVHVKERQRVYDEAAFVESFVVLNAAGRECVDDFQRLREDHGLEELIGHEMPSPSSALPATVKTFYYRGDSACHEHRLINWLRDEEREGKPRGLIDGLSVAIFAEPEIGGRLMLRSPPEGAHLQCGAIFPKIAPIQAG